MRHEPVVAFAEYARKAVAADLSAAVHDRKHRRSALRHERAAAQCISFFAEARRVVVSYQLLDFQFVVAVQNFRRDFALFDRVFSVFFEVEHAHCRVAVQTEILFLFAHARLSAPVFDLYREIRRFLHFEHGAARAYGVDESGIDEIDVADVHFDGVDEFGQDVALVQAAVGIRLQRVEVDFVLEAEVQARVLAALCQHQPRLRLAVRAAEVLQRKLRGRVHLHRQTNRAVEIFDKTVVLRAAEHLVGAHGNEIVEIYSAALDYGYAVALSEIYGIYRFYLACYPFFGEGVVACAVVHERAETFAAYVIAVHSVALEEYRRVDDAVEFFAVRRASGSRVVFHFSASTSSREGMEGAPPFLDMTHAHARTANSVAAASPAALSSASPSSRCAIMLPIKQSPAPVVSATSAGYAA